MTHTISYADGRRRETEAEAEAIRIISAEYPDAVYGDWEESGYTRPRRLVWATEADSEGPDGLGDGGAHAVAEIIRVS
jgi:hypothetical protein